MINFKTRKSKTVLIILIVVTSLTGVITSRQAEVLVNEPAFISCLSEKVENIQWHHTPHGKFNEYVFAGGRFYPPYNTDRFRVDNNITANMYTLVITNVMHSDAGLYECKDDVLSGVFDSTYLTVLDSSPVCTSNMHPSGFVGPNTCNIEQENMTFSCAVSFNGNSPNLMWSTLNGSHVLKSSICESSKDDRINCSLSMRADPSFDGSTFICQTSNDARFICSVKDVRVEYFFGKYEAAQKRVGDNVSCVVGSNRQTHYNWTIQENNQDNIFSANPMISFQKPGFYECSVKYNIRDVTCYALIVAVNVSNIVDDEEAVTISSNVLIVAIGVSIGVSVCLVAVIIAFFIYRMCRRIRDHDQKSWTSLGAGVAYTYFFSYLQIVIPGVWNSFLKEIQRPSAVNEPTENIFLVKKMLIIIPKTLLSPLKLSDVPNFKRTNLSIKQCFDRAGKEKREYTIPIYQMIDKSGNVYYFVTDIPSCLYALREAFDSELSTMSGDDVIKARDDFVQTVKDLLDHPINHSKFADQWELLLWPDDEDKSRMELSEFVSQQIKRKGLAVKLADILNQPITGKHVPDSERPHYALKNNFRGYCIIINNDTFTLPWLECRRRATTEIEELKKLFEGLKFKVDARENLTADQMMTCLKEYRDRDHSRSDAFVCCLLSHGEKGRIYATDEQIPVIKLMELFYDRNCPGLAGKPKLFFIGTCQRKAEDGKYEKMQSTSEEPNSPDIRPGADSYVQLWHEGKQDDLLDFGSLTDSDEPLLPEDNPDLHDSEREGPSVPREIEAKIERELVPSCVDFIVSYACLPETVAWHDSSKGGLYVQSLCKYLNQDQEIDVALRHVSQEVQNLLNTYDKEGIKYSRQDPFHIITPPQKFLFLGSD